MRRLRITVAAAAAITLVAILSAVGHAYVTFAKWSTPAVLYYANPANLDVPAEAAEAALQAGSGVWGTQSAATFDFVYAGRVTDKSTAYDSRNVVIFRNATKPYNASAIATTYSWTSNGKFLEADIVFWDGAFTFFAGTSGCYRGAFIEDIAAHEFGHALGLKHSSVSGATMYPSYSYCSQALRTLELDDKAGVEKLYPPK